ncbi:MAG: 5'-methylthioadenosine/adenosylhomocysteine nucleosidase [Clostridiales bacterium]|uniref:5'-methylthioadenosine/adenosylhomocysteine nucleosidase n=1 Tax=Clostridium sp. N3C TaxID=1776758 RepID=UPI00092DF0D1|nr:5'-methylthioadenosine/adenosylhomocysteine nucleosidase [Clostridium sp. N3C]NLZ48577.1 5'-methylthioadenosine/adenosylhomocysteine nucleosidase [Clostridiales bacterium]SCN24893.1 5'-methylthioadenosine/S-adenosylhomocysteinenucleosidase [Clostridium sp. N3C]
MKIGLISATEREIMPFIMNKMTNKIQIEEAMLKFYTGLYEGLEVVAVFSGVCKVNAAIATQILISKFKVTQLILTGVAGALRQELNIGDIVIGNEIAYHDVVPGILTEYHPWMKDIYFRPDSKMFELCNKVAHSLSLPCKCYTGRIITGEAFITHNERRDLIERFNPLCVDMESASVAHVCYANSVPFLIIRSISDSADESGAEDFEINMAKAALNSLELVQLLLKALSKD